jgi:hypothetical protein
MNKSGLITMTVAATLLLVFCCWPCVWAQPVSVFTSPGHVGSCHLFLLAASDGDSAFDLEWCQRECRMRYGLEPTGGGVGGHAHPGDSGDVWTNASEGSYSLYAACVSECNRRFWSEFEKNVGPSDRRQ